VFKQHMTLKEPATDIVLLSVYIYIYNIIIYYRHCDTTIVIKCTARETKLSQTNIGSKYVSK